MVRRKIEHALPPLLGGLRETAKHTLLLRPRSPALSEEPDPDLRTGLGQASHTGEWLERLGTEQNCFCNCLLMNG